LTKFDAKMTSYKMIKNRPKIDLPWGGRKSSKIVFFRSRGPGPPEMEFFEILHFFAKTPHFSTPKIDPINWCYKNLIPHKNACTFRPMGVKKCHFLGGRRADRSDRKM
jgi:hypothetical protein